MVNTSVPSAALSSTQLHAHGLDRLAGGEGQRARASNVVVGGAEVADRGAVAGVVVDGERRARRRVEPDHEVGEVVLLPRHHVVNRDGGLGDHGLVVGGDHRRADGIERGCAGKVRERQAERLGAFGESVVDQLDLDRLGGLAWREIERSRRRHIVAACERRAVLGGVVHRYDAGARPVEGDDEVRRPIRLVDHRSLIETCGVPGAWLSLSMIVAVAAARAMVALALGLERFMVNTSVPSADGVVDAAARARS